MKTSKCIRCNKECDIVGFCQDCYIELYGLKDKEPIDIPIEKLKCREDYLRLVERNDEYSNEIKESIIKDGLKNPLITNKDLTILIGHHRFFICRDLDYKTLPVYIVDVPIDKFVEGGANNLFIIKIDGNIVASIKQMKQLLPILESWILHTPFWRTSHLVLEAFTCIGASNDHKHWKEKERERCNKMGGEKRLKFIKN